MTTLPRTSTIYRWSSVSLLVLGLTFGSALAQADDPVSSLPDGPKDLLGRIAGDAATLSILIGEERGAGDWIAHLSGMDTAMSGTDLAILAEYLALNAPVEASGDDLSAMLEALPADGRELFAANCLSCHGAAAYYLLQDRDAAGWMDIFTPPYHRRLLTGENERETFSSYAAHAMPIPESDIPDAWKE